MVSFSKKTAFTTTLLVIIVTLMGRDNVVLAQELCSVKMTELTQCTSGDCTCDIICPDEHTCGNEGCVKCSEYKSSISAPAPAPEDNSSALKLCSVKMTELSQCTSGDCTCDIICPDEHTCGNEGCVTCSEYKSSISNVAYPPVVSDGEDEKPSGATTIRGVISSSLVVALAIISLSSII